MATSNEKNLPMMEKFHVGDTTSAGPRWKKYKERFDMMIEAYGIEDEKRQKALLLHSAGEEIFSIYSSFTNKNALTYKQVDEEISKYFTPKKSVEFEVYKFRTCHQKQEETIDQFYARLRSLSENCEFHDPNLEIRMQIIQKCYSDKLRKKTLQESMTLNALLSLARSFEISELQAKEMSTKSEKVSKISQKPINKKKNEEKKCYRCGKNWPHINDKCQAIGKKCIKCGKFNHLSVVCKSKSSVSQIQEDVTESDDSEEI